MKRYLKYLLPLVLILLLFTACGKKEEQTDTQGEATEAVSTEEQKEGIEFPYEIDNGNLVINSVFQSSIENPDCGNEYGDDIASLELVNQSNQYLDSAELTLHMSDGKELHMVIKNIPPGKKVWAFDDQNQLVSNDVVCTSVDCDAEYLADSPMADQEIKVKVDDTTVTLKNQSENDLNDLTIECHCVIDGVYYGGLTYSYPVDKLTSNGSKKIEAEDCFLGEAEVVRIIK